MENDKNFQESVLNLEGRLLNAEEKIGINPLELWMNELLENKKKEKGEEE